MTDQEAFVRLSCTLTGLTDSELPAMVEQQDPTGAPVKLYEFYFERLRAAYPAEFGELLAAWASVQGDPDPAAQLAATLAQADPAGQRLRVAARQVIKIWLLTTIDDPRVPPNPQLRGRNSGQLGGDLGQFQHGAIWPLIGAPAPGYSNFQHGYWVEKPEQP
jgi:hypothetical protein